MILNRGGRKLLELFAVGKQSAKCYGHKNDKVQRQCRFAAYRKINLSQRLLNQGMLPTREDVLPGFALVSGVDVVGTAVLPSRPCSRVSVVEGVALVSGCSVSIGVGGANKSVPIRCTYAINAISLVSLKSIGIPRAFS